MMIRKMIALSLMFILLAGLTVSAAPEESAPDPTAPAAEEDMTAPEIDPAELEAAFPELPDPEEELWGEWYGSLYGLTLVLTLQEDGSYILTYPGVSEEPVQGTWTLEDGFICMDGEEIPSISVLRDRLSWTAPGIFLEREMPESYVPAEVNAQAAQEDFTGYWESAYIDLGGVMVPASDLQDDTFLYIEGTNTALGGSVFGDVIAEFIFADGAMIHEENDGSSSVRIEMKLLQDGFLSVTLSSRSVAEEEASLLKILLVPVYNEYAESRLTQE